MKKLVCTVLLMSSLSAMASSKELVISTFMKNSEVKSLISYSGPRASVAKTPDVALLSASCGFAGCDSNYLVTLAISSFGANPQTHTIAAVVSIPALNFDKPEVKLLSTQDIFDLVR